MCQEKRCKLQSVALLLICILLSVWSLVYKCFADADGIVTGALAFIAFAWISIALYKSKALPSLERIDMLFMLWMVYRWTRMTGPLNFGTLSEDVLCIGVWMYFRMMPVPASWKCLEWMVCLSAAMQVIVVLLQWSGRLPSHHPDFDVTGTFGNPGPLGISLAMAMTIVMPKMVGSGRNVDVRKLIVLVLLGFALFLSDSRAAWLSVVVAVCCLMVLDRLQGRTKRVCLAMLPLAAAIFACAFYFHRPASADARLQIWKNVAEASTLSPILGQGYGSFQSTYMDFQSAQLASQPKAQQWQADDVLAPYNESLGVLYELGLVGLSLFLVFVVCTLRRLYARYMEWKACGLFVLVAYLTFSLFPFLLSLFHFLPTCAGSGLCGIQSGTMEGSPWHGICSVCPCLFRRDSSPCLVQS